MVSLDLFETEYPVMQPLLLYCGVPPATGAMVFGGQLDPDPSFW